MAALILIGAGVGLSAVGGEPSDGGGVSAATSAPRETVTVERRDLVERDELDGTLGFGDPYDVVLGRGGTVTWLPEPGSTVARGALLGEIDGRGVPLLYGERPLWRALQTGDRGADVRQLEANLVALGYATASTLTVDDEFTTATANAVKRWQDAMGWDETGVVALGDAVFLPGAVRVAEHATPVGGAAGAAVLRVTSTERRVVVDFEANRQGLLEEGDAVQIELPSGELIGGTVAHVGNVVESAAESDVPDGSQSDPTIEIVITADDPKATGDLDEAPVTVHVEIDRAGDVLAVPVHALLALAEGGYALERVTTTGTDLVAVELGAFADGAVEVSGGVAEGDEVVVPE